MSKYCCARVGALALLAVGIAVNNAGAADQSAELLARDAFGFFRPAAELSLGRQRLGLDGECSIVISAPPDYPRLMLNTAGPVGTVRALAFSSDSSRVYSAGLDKRVQVWGVRAAGRAIRRSGQANQAVLTSSIRWEVARGLRGVIYALASSPADRQLAIAGYSTRNATGDIVVYDAARLQVLRALRGHLQPVISLDYSPDGARLVSVSSDGQVRLWSAGENWQSRLLRPASPHHLGFQPARFLSNEIVAVAQAADQTRKRWRIALYSVFDLQKPLRVLPVDHQHYVTCIALGGGGRWASADGAGNIYVWNDAREPEARLLGPGGGRTALAMAFDQRDRLFVATQKYRYEDGTAQSVLEMWNTDSGRDAPDDAVETATQEHNFACAVSPDGSRVVTYAGDRDELRIYLLQDRNGRPLATPLSRAPLVLRGSGRRIWKVAFAKDGSYRLGFGTKLSQPNRFGDYGDVEEAFDVGRALPVDVAPDQDGQQAWRSPALDGWEVVPNDRDSSVQLRRNDEVWTTIKLDPMMQGQARSYCWLTDLSGNPYGLALGTNQQQGVFVYRLGSAGQDCPLLRYYRDHTGYVTSLSVSADGQYLASGSIDQTIKIWSLAGLRDRQGPFSRSIAWGATFTKQNGQVVVSSIAEAGTAARKGLRRGDVIVEALFSANLARRLGQPTETVHVPGNPDLSYQALQTAEPEVIFAGLEQLPLTSTVVLTISRSGHRMNRKILIVPAWEPLLTLFADGQGEWALWTRLGYYDASVNGDELFGWQVNRGLETRPDFFRADQFRGRLERPKVIRRVLALGSLAAALREANEAVPDRPDGVVNNQIQKTPRVSILSPSDGEPVNRQTAHVVAQVEYPDPDNAKAMRLRAYVNGVPTGDPAVEGTGRQRTYRWQIDPCDYYNRVDVAVETEDPDQRLSFGNRHFRLDAEGPQVKPRLHLFSVAATKYKSRFLPELRFPVEDAQSVCERLRSQWGGLYKKGAEVSLREEQVSRQGVAEAIKTLQREIGEPRPDDLLVVFLAGHGYAFGQDYFLVPPAADLSTIDPSRMPEDQFNAELRRALERDGIAWRQLRQLSRIRCRKLFLLDTCYAGNIQLEQRSSEHLKGAIRPLVQKDIFVVSATAADKPAIEAKSFGHGAFTKFLLEGFRGAADTEASVGRIDLLEIADYVAREVPRVARTADYAQTPTFAPKWLFEEVPVPLVRAAP